MAAKSSVFVGMALISASILALGLATAAPALAQDAKTESVAFDIPAQPLSKALAEFMRQSNVTVIAPSSMTHGKMSAGVSGDLTPGEALNAILRDTNLDVRERRGGAFALVQAEEVELRDDRTEVGPELEADEIVLEEIVVTGSNIRGAGFGASPGFVIDRSDIESTGFSSVEQLIESLPQNFGGGATVETSGFVDDTDSVANVNSSSTVNLRGLGSDSTLVLLNGRRLAPTANANFVDISAIPLSAVERVEVLTDGASAIYGSDAVGGVVNFILREDYDGAETRVRYGSVTDGGYDELKVSQTLGKSWRTGNALVSYEFFEQSNLPVSDRDFALAAGAREDIDILPELERHSVFTAIRQEVTEKIALYVNGGVTFRDYVSNGGASFRSRLSGNSKNLYVNGGAEVELGAEWQAAVSGSYAFNNTDATQTFVDFGIDVPGELDNDIWSIDTVFDGPIFSLPGGEARLAVGAAFRKETFAGFRDVKRDVIAGFGEISIPLFSESNRRPGIERLEITVAGRFEDYSDFGSTENPKLGLLWSPTPDLTLRSTYSTSFRAAGLTESDPDQITVGGVLFNFEYPGAPFDEDLVLIFALVGQAPTLDPEEAETWTVGFDYVPRSLDGLKVSTTYYNIEFDNRIARPSQSAITPFRSRDPSFFTPLFSFDPTPEQIALGVNGPGGFVNLTTGAFGPPSDPADTQLLFDNRIQNIAITNTDGIDISIDYGVETQHGQFDFGLNGNYIFNFEEAITMASPLFDVVDTVFNPADLRFRARFGWSKDRVSASAFVNYTDGYDDNLADPVADVDSFTTVDLTFAYDTGAVELGAGLFDDLRIALTVQNLFDEDPPMISTAPAPFTGIGYDPTNATGLGRFIAFELGKSF